ncbi:hypothetical protein HBH70_060710 [Parastagonospora nodorum]|nr:hypothetical protein HBH49_057790 [Parastagonospora nodorum]KAH4071751.1 hypothetical protein HBH50_068140 [Parastagonospora nodorum]KAH4094635.1 hypothetical protein HBH48_056410 [Parastagonospora nodorum]KAH4230677.1 hypothetical protein HBI06_081430 [Parastagonospora nodorum]KAH4245144.1 hypothetical protein HBI05_064570 [Parastagonospora nodorum]
MDTHKSPSCFLTLHIRCRSRHFSDAPRECNMPLGFPAPPGRAVLPGSRGELPASRVRHSTSECALFGTCDERTSFIQGGEEITSFVSKRLDTHYHSFAFHKFSGATFAQSPVELSTKDLQLRLRNDETSLSVPRSKLFADRIGAWASGNVAVLIPQVISTRAGYGRSRWNG